MLVPLQPLTPPTAAPLEISCYTLTSPQTFRALQPNLASMWHAASPAPTHTTPTTPLDISLPALRSMSYTLSRPSRLHTTSPRMTSPPPPILIDVAKITGHQCVRGRGGAIVVLYETHWNGILRPTWERELNLQAFRHLIIAYWANGPDHHQPNTRKYQQLRINAAARELARAKRRTPPPRFLPARHY